MTNIRYGDEQACLAPVAVLGIVSVSIVSVSIVNITIVSVNCIRGGEHLHPPTVIGILSSGIGIGNRKDDSYDNSKDCPENDDEIS